MLASFILFDDGEVPFPEGVKVDIRTGFHIHDNTNQAIEEILAHAQAALPGKRALAQVVVKVPDDAIMEAADLIEQEMMGTLVTVTDEELEDMFGHLPPSPPDWKEQYKSFATSFTEKLTTKVEQAANPLEVIAFLDELFAEMAMQRTITGPGELVAEIMEAAKTNEEQRKAQRWVDLGL